MKKIFALVLSFLFICSVSAETEDYKTNYVVGSNFYCGSEKVELVSYIEKSGKLLVRESNNFDNYYIWKESNECENVTTQDWLDLNNSPITGIYRQDDEGGNIVVDYITADVQYTYAVVPAYGKYDSSKKYFYMTNRPWEADEGVVTKDNYLEYYEYAYLKTPDTVNIEANTTYYVYNNMYSYKVADNSTLDSTNIEQAKVLVTPKEINLKTTTYTMNEVLFETLITNANEYSFEYLANKLVLKVDYDGEGDIKYFDMDGTEITKYRGFNVVKTENFTLMAPYDESYIKVYNGDETKLLSNIIMTNSDYINGVYVTKSSLTIDYYYNNQNDFVYFNMYKMVSGDNQTFYSDTNKNITIKFNGNYETFRELKIDDVVIPSTNYTVKKGSTIITLKKSYLSTLSEGVHTVSAVYIDGGFANATLNISANVENPQTADNIWIYISLGIISLGGIVILGKKCLIK